MICMLTVPASMTSRDLLEFVAAYEKWIESMKIIKDNTPNKYMVLIKFNNQVIKILRCLFVVSPPS